MDWSTIKTQANQIKTTLDNIVTELKAQASEISIADCNIVIKGCDHLIGQLVFIRDKAMEKKAKTQAELDYDVLEAIRVAPDCQESKQLDQDNRPASYTYSSASLGKRAIVARIYEPDPRGKRLIGTDLTVENL